MAASDITIEILKDIRDEIRGTNKRLDVNNERLDTVESTLLDLAEQERFVVRYTRAISERDLKLETRVSDLEGRVDKLESE